MPSDKAVNAMPPNNPAVMRELAGFILLLPFQAIRGNLSAISAALKGAACGGESLSRNGLRQRQFPKGKRSARGAAPQEPRLQGSSVGIGSILCANAEPTAEAPHDDTSLSRFTVTNSCSRLCKIRASRFTYSFTQPAILVLEFSSREGRPWASFDQKCQVI
jgi:hypothetical protein